MLIFDQLAERCIQEAQARGDFTDLPGAGKPLADEDMALVPEELRAAYRLLKNAGYVPPEVEARKEAASLRSLIATLDDDQARARAQIKLQLLALRISGRSDSMLEAAGPYTDALVDRFCQSR